MITSVEPNVFNHIPYKNGGGIKVKHSEVLRNT